MRYMQSIISTYPKDRNAPYNTRVLGRCQRLVGLADVALRLAGSSAAIGTLDDDVLLF
jgi:hypothetical protein